MKFHRSLIGKTKHISRDKKCKSLNRVSSGNEKNVQISSLKKALCSQASAV